MRQPNERSCDTPSVAEIAIRVLDSDEIDRVAAVLGLSRLHQGDGFYHGTWATYRPSGYPEHAYQASRVQQINVGRRVLAAVGPSAWGCAGVAGLTAGA